MNKYLFTFLVLITFNFSCSHPKKDFKIEESFIQAGDKKLQVITAGDGKNTIVFETGLGLDDSTWINCGLFDSLRKDNQVIIYNRSGYGKSKVGNDKRGMQDLANDLELIIQNKSRNDKVILVGHSLGGSIIRTFAVQHPGKVKALLFIDPNTENFTPYATFTQEQEDTLVAQLKSAGISGAAMEAAQLIENVDFLKKLRGLPDVPVIVITSTKTDEEMTPENVLDWTNAHSLLGNGVSDFTHIETDKYGHFIYEENPELVLEQVRKLVK